MAVKLNVKWGKEQFKDIEVSLGNLFLLLWLTPISEYQMIMLLNYVLF